MNDNPFIRFIALIKFDQEVCFKEKEVQKVKVESDFIKKDIDKLSVDLEHSHKKLINMKKEGSLKEMEMKDLDVLEQEKKKRLENISTQQEYKAIKKEMNSIKQNQIAYELVLIETWKNLDTVSREYESKKNEYENKNKQFKDSLQEKELKIESLQVELAEQYKKRLEMEKGVPKEWVERYTMMRSSTTNSVVPVINNSCSACFYEVSSQLMLDMKRNKLVQCKGCYRFLYLPEE